MPTEETVTTPTSDAPIESTSSKGLSVWGRDESGKPAEQIKSQPEQTPATTPATTPAEPTQQQLEAEAVKRGMSVEELAEVIALANEKANDKAEARKAASQPKPGMTEADFKKQFGVFEVAPQEFAAIFGMEEASAEQVAAFNQIIQRTAAMAVRMSEYKAKEMNDGMRTEYGPFRDTVARMNSKALENRFVAKYPNLVKYDQMVKDVAERAKREGKKFKSSEEGLDWVAQETIRKLKSVGIDVAAQAAPTKVQQSNVATQQVKKPASVSMGGHVGTNKSASSATQSKGLSIFM